MAITPPRALHADASNCFNLYWLGRILTADNTSLTFTALDAPVLTFTENSANATFTGTDSNNIPYIANQLNGTFPSSARGTFNLAGDIA